MYLRLTLLALIALVVASCSEPKRMEITQTRELQPTEQKPKLDATDRERFELSMLMAGVPQQDTRPVEPSQGTTSSGRAALAFDTPEGWTEAEKTSMRDVNLRFGENDEGECYAMRAGGSLAANVNRWRGQMGLEPATDDELNNLETRNLFGFPAYVVDISGDFKGMGAGEAKTDYRMLGLILPVGNSGQSLFVKMTGPKQLVDDNETKFHEFCDTLRIEQN